MALCYIMEIWHCSFPSSSSFLSFCFYFYFCIFMNELLVWEGFDSSSSSSLVLLWINFWSRKDLASRKLIPLIYFKKSLFGGIFIFLLFFFFTYSILFFTFVFPSLLGRGIFDLKEFDTLYFLFSNLHLIFISKGQPFGGIFVFLPLFKFFLNIIFSSLLGWAVFFFFFW